MEIRVIRRRRWALLLSIILLSQAEMLHVRSSGNPQEITKSSSKSDDLPYPSGETSVFENRQTGKICVVSTVWPDLEGKTQFEESYWQTSDLGRTWRRAKQLDVVYDPMRLGSHPADPGTIYRICGEVGIRMCLERSEDTGKTWQKAQAKIKGTQIELASYIFQAFHPRNPATLYVVGNILGAESLGGSDLPGLYVSTDKGDTFSLIAANVDSRTLAISKSNPKIMYAGILYQYIIKTEDGGMGWRLVGPFTQNSTECASQQDLAEQEKIEFTTGRHPIYHIEIDRRDSQTVYARSDFGIWKTSNGGQHWCLCNIGSAADIKIGSMVLAGDEHDEAIFAGTNSGLFVSRDGARTWSRVNVRKDFK